MPPRLSSVMSCKNASRPSGSRPPIGSSRNEILRPCCQHARDGHAPLLPAGEAHRRLVVDLLEREANRFERPAHARLLFGGAQAAVLQAEGHVLFHGRFKELTFRILEYNADFAPQNAAVIAAGVDVLPVEHDGAGRRREQTGHDLNERGLAAAGAAEDADEAAVFDCDGYIAQRSSLKRCPRAVDTRQIRYCDRHSSSASSSSVSGQRASVIPACFRS